MRQIYSSTINILCCLLEERYRSTFFLPCFILFWKFCTSACCSSVSLCAVRQKVHRNNDPGDKLCERKRLDLAWFAKWSGISSLIFLVSDVLDFWDYRRVFNRCSMKSSYDSPLRIMHKKMSLYSHYWHRFYHVITCRL